MAEALWRKAIERRLDETDVKLLNLLAEDSGFDDACLEYIANKTNQKITIVKKRIELLKKKGIIIRDRVSLLELINIWDNYFMILIKAKFQAPIVGFEIKYPVGRSNIIKELLEVENKFPKNIIRQAFLLHGAEWDLLLIATANDYNDIEEFLDNLINGGWVDKVWVMKPLELGGSWIFDPIEVPTLKEYEERVKNPILSADDKPMEISIWKKPFERELEELDIKILKFLSTEIRFSEEELEKLANKLKISLDELKNRLNILKKKNILMKERISVIDMLKIWDNYFITWIKAKLQAPLTGVLKQYPLVWSEIVPAIKKAEESLGLNIVRQAFALHGTEWDLMLITTVNDNNDFQKFMEFLVEQGWIEKSWTMRPSELGGSWIFDPIEVPTLKEYEERVKTPVSKIEKSLK